MVPDVIAHYQISSRHRYVTTYAENCQAIQGRCILMEERIFAMHPLWPYKATSKNDWNIALNVLLPNIYMYWIKWIKWHVYLKIYSVCDTLRETIVSTRVLWGQQNRRWHAKTRLLRASFNYLATHSSIAKYRYLYMQIHPLRQITTLPDLIYVSHHLINCDHVRPSIINGTQPTC